MHAFRFSQNREREAESRVNVKATSRRLVGVWGGSAEEEEEKEGEVGGSYTFFFSSF
jgi:hypothetical protein